MVGVGTTDFPINYQYYCPFCGVVWGRELIETNEIFGHAITGGRYFTGPKFYYRESSCAKCTKEIVLPSYPVFSTSLTWFPVFCWTSKYNGNRWLSKEVLASDFLTIWEILYG